MQNEELWRKCWLFVFVWGLSWTGDVVLADELPWAEDALEPGQYESHVDVLQGLEDTPVNLNQADASALLSLPWLSEVQVQAILRFRDTYGPFRCIEDLRNVEGMDEELIEVLRPYVVLPARGHGERRTPVVHARCRLTCPLLSSSATLSTWRIYTKACASFGSHVRTGWVAERDPGEPRWADFWAGYLEIQDIGGVDRMVIGDFRPGFGQGVVFSRWSWFSGGWDALKRRESRSFGYSSVTESGALRGGLVQQRYGPVTATLFISFARWDALLDAEGKVRSLSYDGQHVSASERAKRDVLQEQLLGGRLHWGMNSEGHVGCTVARSRFDPAFTDDRGDRDRFAPSGSSMWWVSTDWDLYLADLNLFGEMALSKRAGGLVIGAIIDRRTLQIKALIRAYGRDFHGIHGSSFSATGSEDGNEIGAFWGIGWRSGKGRYFSIYVDGYRQPWRGYRDILPTGGTTFGGQWKQRWGHAGTALRFRYKDRETTEGIDGTYDMVTYPRRELRWEGYWRRGGRFRIRGRTECIWVEHGEGTALFMDVRLQPWRKMTWEGRVTLFDVSTYAARIYEAEGSLRGALSMTTWTGRGRRWYIIGRQMIGNSMWSAKLGRTVRVWPQPERRETSFSIQVTMDRE